MNSAKKIGLFLLITFFPASSFGMFEKAQKNISTFVISSEKQMAAAVLVPLTIAGGVVLAQHKDDVSSLFENMPVPSGNTALVLATAIAMPLTYGILRRFSPEQQINIYKNNIQQINEHMIFAHTNILKTMLEHKEADTIVLDFVNTHFSDESDKNLPPTIKAVHQLCELERLIKEESKRLQAVEDMGDTQFNGQQKVFKNDIKFIKNLRGKIVASPQHQTAQAHSAAVQRNNLTEQRMTFTNKIGSLIQMLQLPAMTAFSMIFLQIMLNKLGLEYRVV